MAPPGYIALLQSGALQRRIDKLYAMLTACRLCPWQCGADRASGQTGKCGAGASVRLAKAVAHYGEEPVITGGNGSGGLFFSHCNLSCCFCQNFQISQEGMGADLSVEELVRRMLALQQQGCHNINLVSAAHYLPYIVAALGRAAAEGLRLPIVYNSNGYESVETLALLEGIVDVYLPDMKYADDAAAQKYSGARSYTKVNRAAIDEMIRQTGYLLLDDHGLACRGTIIRHLMLPGGLSDTTRVLRGIRSRYGRFAAVSLMAQYTPCHRAARFPELAARVSRSDYEQAVALFESLGFEYGWTQEYDRLDRSFVPDFGKQNAWS